MRDLLEGLNSHEGAERTPIYAFATEGTSASDEAWLDKGATTIPYSPRDKGHGVLCDITCCETGNFGLHSCRKPGVS